MTHDDLATSPDRSDEGPLLSPEEFRSSYASPIPWGLAALVCNPCLITSVFAISRAVGQLRAMNRMGASRDPSFAGLRLEAYATFVLACAWPLLIMVVITMTAASGGLLAAGRAGAPPPEHANYDFWEARREHPTNLARRGAAPQEFDPEAPEGVEIVHYRSDVGELLGWVLQPDGVTPGTRLPTMVYAHGGFALGEGDLHIAQLFANAGMLVFLPAVRGENGNPGHYEMFFGEVEDLLAATRYVAARPDVDPTRVFVFGHSAGGVLSSLLALRPESRVVATGSSGSMYLPIALPDFGPELLPFDASNPWESQLRSMLPHVAHLAVPHTAYVGTDDEFIMQDIDEIRRLGARGGSLFSLEILEGDHHTSLEQAAIDFMTRVAPELAVNPEDVRRAVLHGDEDARRRALAAVFSNPIPLHAEARRELLGLATEVTAPADRTILIRAALERAPDSVLEVLPALYERLDEPGRQTVVTMLGRLPSLRALEALVAIAANATTESEIQLTALFSIMDHCENGRAATSLGTLTQVVDTRLERLWPALERADRERTWEAPEHQGTREAAGVLLDLVGCLPHASESPWIARGTGLHDLRLRMFATMAGLRVGIQPSPASVRELAEHDGTRALLLQALERAHAVALFPAEFWTRQALARSHAIAWLEYPTELGAPPRALEWVAEVREDDGYYVVMRYQAPADHPEPDTWRVVIAGPYVGDHPPAASPFHTFSDFEPIDSATPREHVQRIVSRLPTQ